MSEGTFNSEPILFNRQRDGKRFSPAGD